MIVAVPAEVALKTPVLLMLPMLVGLTVHVAAELKVPVPVTVALHVELCPEEIVEGEQATATAVMVGVEVPPPPELEPGPPPQPVSTTPLPRVAKVMELKRTRQQILLRSRSIDAVPLTKRAPNWRARRSFPLCGSLINVHIAVSTPSVLACSLRQLLGAPIESGLLNA